jgi:hypothetical protein
VLVLILVLVLVLVLETLTYFTGPPTSTAAASTPINRIGPIKPVAP